MTEAEQELQEALISSSGNFWYLWFLARKAHVELDKLEHMIKDTIKENQTMFDLTQDEVSFIRARRMAQIFPPPPPPQDPIKPPTQDPVKPPTLPDELIDMAGRMSKEMVVLLNLIEDQYIRLYGSADKDLGTRPVIQDGEGILRSTCACIHETRSLIELGQALMRRF
jgi:hypothetical protein